MRMSVFVRYVGVLLEPKIDGTVFKILFCFLPYSIIQNLSIYLIIIIKLSSAGDRLRICFWYFKFGSWKISNFSNFQIFIEFFFPHLGDPIQMSLFFSHIWECHPHFPLSWFKKKYVSSPFSLPFLKIKSFITLQAQFLLSIMIVIWAQLGYFFLNNISFIFIHIGLNLQKVDLMCGCVCMFTNLASCETISYIELNCATQAKPKAKQS